MVSDMFWSVNSALLSKVFVTLDPSDGAKRTRSPGTWEERSAGMTSAAGIRSRWWSMVLVRLVCEGSRAAERGGAAGAEGWVPPGQTRHRIRKGRPVDAQ